MPIPEFRDTVPPFVFGYLTTAWFGDTLGPKNPNLLQALSHGGKLIVAEVGKGVVGGAYHNGTVFFDFSKCEDTPLIIHRGSLYNDVAPDENGGRSDKKVGAQIRRTENRQNQNQLFAVSVIMAHLLLLESAIQKYSNVAMSLPRVETIEDTNSTFELGAYNPNQSKYVGKSATLGSGFITSR